MSVVHGCPYKLTHAKELTFDVKCDFNHDIYVALSHCYMWHKFLALDIQTRANLCAPKVLGA